MRPDIFIKNIKNKQYQKQEYVVLKKKEVKGKEGTSRGRILAFCWGLCLPFLSLLQSVRQTLQSVRQTLTPWLLMPLICTLVEGCGAECLLPTIVNHNGFLCVPFIFAAQQNVFH